jgi:hypothetical protein
VPDTDNTPHRDEADAKAWFYLDHWRDIEQWASLRGAAASLLDGLLLELGPKVEALAEELGGTYVTHGVEGGAYPGFGLRRTGWARSGLNCVSIVIQWERNKLLKPGANQWPFVAVLVDEPIKRSTRAALSGALGSARKQFGRNDPADDWLLWDYVSRTATRTPFPQKPLARRRLSGSAMSGTPLLQLSMGFRHLNGD